MGSIGHYRVIYTNLDTETVLIQTDHFYSSLLIADLTADLPAAVRLHRLVGILKTWFGCGAVVLLRLEETVLRPVAQDGLVKEALGRRFSVAEHPRLATLLQTREPLVFDPASPLPDPYDGLLLDMAHEPLPVHDCMGMALHVEGQLWGVLTLDAMQAGTFEEEARQRLSQVSLVVEAAIRVGRMEQHIKAMRRFNGDRLMERDVLDRASPEEIIGHSTALNEAVRELAVVAGSDLPVLFLGETGVGKELFARQLHRQSQRGGGPLVQVNCAAMPETLAESELFGHAKGAFSGAMSDRPGRFEAATGGTLFLDEVGELPLPVQAKLLRTLQNGEIQRLGSDQPRKVDVRIIAATNRDLRQEVRDGCFRADLYHRLSVYPFRVPPLRERVDDILPLAGHFLELNRARLGARSLHLSPEAEAALCQYHWPGNVRELEHVISRASLKALVQGSDRSQIIRLEAGWLDLDITVSPVVAKDSNLSEAVPSSLTLNQAVVIAQRRQIRQALSETQGNWRQAALKLDIDASNLHRLARRLGLK